MALDAEPAIAAVPRESGYAGPEATRFWPRLMMVAAPSHPGIAHHDHDHDHGAAAPRQGDRQPRSPVQTQTAPVHAPEGHPEPGGR